MAVDTFPGAGFALVRDDPRNRYHAAGAALVLAATPTDAVIVTGSSTKRVRILRVDVSGAAATAAQAIPVQLLFRSAGATGGTSSAATAVPADSTMAAATAAVKAYTVNPSGAGTAVGAVGWQVVPFGLATTGGNGVSFNFADRSGPGFVLNGTAESLAIHLNGVTLNNATSLNYTIVWEEE